MNAGRPNRILYVDDSKFDRELVKDAMAQAPWAFELVLAESRAAFEEALSGNGPWDLVLTDFNILGFEGLQVLDAVRAEDSRIPVVIITGTGSEEIAAEALRRGVSDYVLKTPRQIRHLPVTLKGILDHAQLEKDRRRAIEEEEAALSILEATLEATADGLLVVDQNLRVMRANSKFFDMWGVPESLRQSRDDAELLSFATSQLEDPEAFIRTVYELYADPTTVSTHQLRFKDGRIYERHSQPQRFGPSSQGRVWSFRDITARIRAEGALKESEERYRTVVETAPDAIFIAQGGTFAYLNSACLALYGVGSKSELLGREVVACVHPDDQEEVRAALDSFLDPAQRPVPVECRIQGRDGVERLAEVVGTPIRFLGGQALQVLSRDITQRKRAEEALRESEDNYRRLVESAPDPIFVEIDGSFAYLNPAAQELLGPGDLVGRPILDIVTTPDRELVAGRLTQFAEDHAPLPRVEVFIRALDGRLIEVEVTTTPTVYQGVPAARVYLRDVTERRVAQRALLKEKKFSDEAINSLPGVFYAFTPEGRFIRWNDNFKTVSGYTDDEIAGMTPANFFTGEDFPKVLAAIQHVFRKGEDQFEAPFLLKDGSRIDYLFTGRRMQGETGPILVGMGIDLSSRKAAEAAVAESEDRYRTLVEQAPDCIFVASEGRFLYINPAGLRIFEADSESELLGQSLLDRIHPEDQPRMLRRSEHLYATGQPMPPEELRIIGLKGHEVVAEFTTTAIQYKGRPAARVFLKDVTSRRRAEEALKASEATLRAFFNSAPFQMGVSELAEDDDVFLVSANEAWANLMGVDPEDCPGKRIRELGISEEVQGIWLEHYREAWQSDTPARFEFEYLAPGRPAAWFLVTLAFIGEGVTGRPRFSFVMEDVTERNAAAQALAESEARYRLISESMQDLICLHEPDGRYRYVSPSVQDLLGFEPQELIGVDPYTLFHPEDIPAIQASHKVALDPAEGKTVVQYRLRRKDGTYVWMETLTRQIKDAEGRVTKLQTSSRDITARRAAEEDRRSAEKRFRHLIENSVDGLVLGKPEGIITYSSPAASAILGYSEAELAKLNPYHLVHPEDLPRVTELMYGKVVPNPGVAQVIEMRMRRKDDAWRWLEISFTNWLDDPSLASLVVNFRDITDRKMEEILEADRRAVLELVAQNMPLDATLACIASLMEHQRPGMTALIELVEGGHVKFGIGPSIPPALLEALQGTPVAPGMGSCEEAAHAGQPVLAPNIATHPSWIHRRELARTHQLRACWAHPVLSASGHVLGSIGLFDRDPRVPADQDLELLATTSRLAAVAIEHLQLTEQLSHQAQHDALTGLPNRLLFEDRLRQAL
ncbi:MAG TPA: PAS domain S-box protein, partial [Holophagaceae bacterium]|nr:PAS domain S-box protein [Holophagaceae bacterium]